jgi:hypothetical protein
MILARLDRLPHGQSIERERQGFANLSSLLRFLTEQTNVSDGV